MNPEFVRNLWLEVSRQRLVMMTLTLGSILYLAWSWSPEKSLGLETTAATLFVLLTYFWGTRRTSESVMEEVRDRTWDFQRMSSLGAWSMTWGKLFGSTAYVWYGAAICLLTFALSTVSRGGDLLTLMKSLIVLVGSAVLTNTVAMLASLDATQKGRIVKRSTGQSLVLGLFIGTWFLGTGIWQAVDFGDISWWNGEYNGLNFVVVSLLVFDVWALVGAYRLMRHELQFRCAPWVWLSFVLFLMFYASGFELESLTMVTRPFAMHGAGASADSRLFVSALIGVLCSYLMIFRESKNPVVFRKLFAAVDRGAWRDVFWVLPRWLVTLVLTAVMSVLVALTAPNPEITESIKVPLSVWALALFLFLLRDVLIVLYLNLSRGSGGRTDLAAMIYLMLLYLLVPLVLRTIGLSSLLSCFHITIGSSAAGTLLPPFLEVALLTTFLVRRWRRNEAQIGSTSFVGAT